MKLPAYPKYKPSGVEWLGDLPEQWEVKRAGLMFQIQLGKMLQPDESGPLDAEVPYLKAQHVQWETVRTSDLPSMWASPNDRLKYDVADGDLLVCEGGDVGRAGIVRAPPADLVFQNALHRVRPTGRSSLGFLLYVLEHAAAQDWFSILCNRSTIAHFTGEKFSALRLPHPSVGEQQTIANFLDRETAKIDTLVAKKRTLIERLKEKRTTLISRTVTRGLPPDAARAAGLDPHPKLKPSGIDWLGDVPEHWEPDRLRRACTRVTDGAHISPDLSSPDYPFVSTVDITNGQIDLMGCLWTFTDCFEYLAHTGCQPRRNDVLFSKDGTIGRTAVVQSDTDFVVASSLVILSPKPTRLIARYLDYWLNNTLLQQDMLLQLVGAALRRISVEKVGRLPVFVPPISEQTAISDFLDRETAKIDAMVFKVDTAIERLQEYRTALITAAVTGKIDVRGSAA
jgi:type I restriction enzyme S subunit